MKRFPLQPTILMLPFVLAAAFSCSGIKQSVSENDDSYYSSSDSKADKEASSRKQEPANPPAAGVAKQEQQSQPDYVNPEYKASGRTSAPLRPQEQTSTGQGNTIINNNYYQGGNAWNWGGGFSPYTSLGYNWMFPGYSGFSWRVSSFWGPMWATSLCDPWDFGPGFAPYYGNLYRPYYGFYNPWVYRPFYYSPGYYGGSYWDNYQGGSSGGGGQTGGRVRTNLPMGGTGTGVMPSGTYSSGRSGRTGGRQAVADPPVGGRYSSTENPAIGTRDDRKSTETGFWRRREERISTGNTGVSGAEPEDRRSPIGQSGNTQPERRSEGFWQRSRSNEVSSPNSPDRSDRSGFAPAQRTDFGSRRSESGPSSGWGSGTVGGRTRSVAPSSGSGGRRR